jgi:hypothetical protein
MDFWKLEEDQLVCGENFKCDDSCDVFCEDFCEDSRIIRRLKNHQKTQESSEDSRIIRRLKNHQKTQESPGDSRIIRRLKNDHSIKLLRDNNTKTSLKLIISPPNLKSFQFAKSATTSFQNIFIVRRRKKEARGFVSRFNQNFSTAPTHLWKRLFTEAILHRMRERRKKLKNDNFRFVCFSSF